MKCKNCGQESNQEDICIHCGENPKRESKTSGKKDELATNQVKNKGMSKGLKIGLGCCGGLIILIIILAAIGSKGVQTTKNPTLKPSSTTTAPTPATPTPTPKAKEWVVVVELKGTTDKRSDTFELTGGKTKMTYNFNGNDWIVGSIYIVKEGHDLDTEGGLPEVTISKSGEDSTFLSKGKGKYFLDVTAANTTSWTIKIEEEK